MQNLDNSWTTPDGAARAPSLDDLFRRSVARRPEAEALIDPQDKPRVTGGAPLRLTYADADRAIANLAAHFADVPLPAGSTVAIQLPNTVEMFLSVLAAMRAGLNVALIPLLWRKADLTDALNRIGARAIVTMSRIDGVDYTAHAIDAAVDAFSIRHICAFGANVPDGLAALDEIVFGNGDADPRLSSRDAQRASFVTFDVTAAGLVVVPRTQVQLIANGLGLTMGLNLPAEPRIMSAIMPSSAAGFCLSGVAWLISGGTLLLHHPFDESVLLQALAGEACTDFIAPAPLALRLGENPEFLAAAELGQVIGLWRNPDQALGSSVWTGPQGFHDVLAFGEAGFVPTMRDNTGAATPINMRAHALSASVGEIVMTNMGTLGLRGPVVPSLAYADERDGNGFRTPAPADIIDTGFAARHDPATGTVHLTAPPAGLIGVGGYRFRAGELEDWSHRLPQGGLLTALPDRMTGHRLAGRTVNTAAARGILSELGLNPLVGEAFRDRS